MTPKQIANENKGNTVIKALEKRNMTGHFVHTSQEAVAFVNNFIKDQSIVSWGGSMTLSESGILESLKDRDLNLLDRSTKTTAEEIGKLYRESFSADYYLMSANAITLDGKLVNVDGNGNRVAALIFGPNQVLVVAGMNKVCVDEESALKRVRNTAAPANATRLNSKTPCAKSGTCHECLLDDCLCCQTLVTRKSKQADRIHVLLVGEELGY
jgi:hypothetical protein